jgi:hypothetical protein
MNKVAETTLLINAYLIDCTGSEAKKAPVALQKPGRADREDHHRLHSRSTKFPDGTVT